MTVSDDKRLYQLALRAGCASMMARRTKMIDSNVTGLTRGNVLCFWNVEKH